MPETVDVVAAQYPVDYLNVAVNSQRAEQVVTQAAAEGADLVVLPELTNVGYPRSDAAQDRHEYYHAAASSDQGFLDTLQNLATTHGMTVVAGLALHHHTVAGVLINAAVVLAPDGSRVVAPKTHLPRLEKQYFALGSALVVADTPVGRLGLLTCADNSFPEPARVLALRGIDILCVSYMAPRQTSPDLYRAIAVTRAFENQCFVVASQACGSQGELALTEETCIAGPDGSLLATAGGGPGSARATLVSADLVAQRLFLPRFQDRRPELYGDLSVGITNRQSTTMPDGSA
ncbi:carbon-nitrogen hydrolase family protein [Aeromicrobium sp. CTD01-1L150]|uniref:carbon-nitrogen hydrolase family protein n=1 Tax=Aeromicrobium sp. CTD01-1L150 TaxID=3341830 RepID=UPI0035C22554